MILSGSTLSGSALSGTSGGGGSIVPPQPPSVPTFHDYLAELAHQHIERERQVLLGVDSSLDLYSRSGLDRTLLTTLSAPETFSVFHVTNLGGIEEWFCDVVETDDTSWTLMRRITEVVVNTHGQDQTYKVVTVERPIETAHVYRLRLEAIGDLGS